MLNDIAQVIMEEIKQRIAVKSPVLTAIDGRCAAGKTSLAAYLQKKCDCNVIHLDHFFLRPEQRTAERLRQAGGNVDYERFLKEVLIPLYEGQTFSYRPYDCHRQELGEPVWIPTKVLTIVEGSYSCHPALKDYYDLSIFLNVDPEEQIRRIRLRNGAEGVLVFQERWIPMEEQYFHSLGISESCDLCFQT